MNYGARQTDRESRIRRSIVRLLSLADRVERSSFQFVLVRVFLLWLLRPAERRMREYLYNMARNAGVCELPDIFVVADAADSGQIPCNSPQVALDMALRLRILAGLMAWLCGIDIFSDGAGDDVVRTNMERHKRWLATALQTYSLLQARGGKSGCTTSGRPEVRQGLCPGLS